MHFYFEYDNEAAVESVIIRPDNNEDPGVLHNYSRILKVSNPMIQFAQSAKDGKFNWYTDEDFNVMLACFKEFDELFFKDKNDVNIFQLLADMTEYIFQNYCFSHSVKPEKGQDSEDENKTDSLKTPWD